MAGIHPEYLSNPKAALLHLRIIWSGLLAGPVVFLFVVLALVSQQSDAAVQNDEDVVRILGYIAIAMLVVLTPIGYFIRNQLYKASWQGNVVKPWGYILGNIILLAMVEAVSFFGLIGTLLAGSFSSLPFIAAVIAMAIQVINFPHGRPMFEQQEIDSMYDRGER